jgi:acyl-CoA dehydrogenase
VKHFLQQPPELGNQYEDDVFLQSCLRRLLPTEVLRDMQPQFKRMGQLAIDLWEISKLHRRAEPQHIAYDAWGQRIDKILNTPSWQVFAKIAAEEGLVATAYERRYAEHSRLCQFTLVYLFDRSTQVYTCPLAMTDGCARTLEILGDHHATVHRLTNRDPMQAWTSGQWMTETTGGSDVGLSQTIARIENGVWRLYGLKWFTSAVTCDVALTLARPEGNGPGGKGLALFLVELRDSNGRLRNISVNRLKDKLGTRHVPTAELTLEGTPALPVAGLDNGVRNMSTMLNLTRTWNAVCSVAALQRGLTLCRDYAKKRVAFGALLAEKPLHIKLLADLTAQHHAGLVLVLEIAKRVGQEEHQLLSEDKLCELRALQLLAKLWTAKIAVASASEVLEAFGGAGYVEDTGLPELLRDAQVLPIWEGTTNVLSLETLRALKREGAWDNLSSTVNQRLERSQHAELRHAVLFGRERFAVLNQWWSNESNELGARTFALALAQTIALALLIEQAEWMFSNENDRRGIVAAKHFARACEKHVLIFDENLDDLRALAI